MKPVFRMLVLAGLLIAFKPAHAAPPTVSLIYPPASASFIAPAAFNLTVVAADADGPITKVEYLVGGALFGTVSAPVPTGPFSVPLSNVAAGTYVFSVRATDAQGEVTTSNSATISVYNAVTGNTPPTVNVAVPVNGAAYSLGGGPVAVPIYASASDPNGVNRIELYLNAAYQGTVLGSTLDGVLTLTTPGTYALVARAYDSFGAAANSPAKTITIHAGAPGNNPPAVNLSSPLQGAVYLPSASIPVSAAASDPDGSVNRVEFLLNDALLAVMTAAPYTFSLPGLSVGNHTFKARAYDNLGVRTDSAPVTVTVNTPPTVGMTQPANNTVVPAPGTFTLQANASDADGNLSKVEFYQGATLLGEDTAPPYTWTLNGVAYGTYAYTAKAYDALGGTATSGAVNVVVNALPNVNLTASSAFGGFHAPAEILLTASASDADGTISKVEFYSGSQPVGTKTAAPYQLTLSGVQPGTYSYTAKAYDNRSATTTSSPVSVTVAPALSPSAYTYDELGRLIGVQH